MRVYNLIYHSLGFALSLIKFGYSSQLLTGVFIAIMHKSQARKVCREILVRLAKLGEQKQVVLSELVGRATRWAID